MFVVISPSLRSDHEMIENCASKIHQNAMRREHGRHDERDQHHRAQIIALNGRFLFSSSAR